MLETLKKKRKTDIYLVLAAFLFALALGVVTTALEASGATRMGEWVEKGVAAIAALTVVAWCLWTLHSTWRFLLWLIEPYPEGFGWVGAIGLYCTGYFAWTLFRSRKAKDIVKD